VGVFAPVQDLSVDDFRLQIETNLCGVFYCSKAAVEHLTRHGDGWIVNIASLAGRNPFAGGTAYNATKFGLVGMTEAMMLDLRHQGIRVSVVMPGSVDTDFSHPGGAGGRPWALTADDVARAVLGLMDFPPHAHVSRVEMRPSRPPGK
jgi:NAD(P)-dependent dehydrogenase (short-subunit alcohol dehydrogenase family)